MDDIVTRLRHIEKLSKPVAGEYIPQTASQAANEIERLRTDLNELLWITKLFADNGECRDYKEQWGYCTHSPCDWHDAEHMWESFCMQRGL